MAITHLAIRPSFCVGFVTPLPTHNNIHQHEYSYRYNKLAIAGAGSASASATLVLKSNAEDHSQQGDVERGATTATVAKEGRKSERQLRQLAYVMINDVEDLLKAGGASASSLSSSSSSSSEAPVAKALENIERMELLLQQEAEAEKKGDDGEIEFQTQIMSDLFSCLVRVHAKSPGVRGHAKLAEETFRDMRSRGLKPNVATACAVIDGYARSRDKGAVGSRTTAV